MIEIIALLLVGASGLLVALWWLHWQARFRRRSIDDVVVFFRAVDRGRFIALVSPPESVLPRSAKLGAYRLEQRANLEQLREFIKRMVHNVRITGEWGRTERLDMKRHHLQYDDRTRQCIKDLILADQVFRRASRLVLCRMWFWCFIHFDKWKFLPFPALSNFRQARNVDLLEAYQRANHAALNLALRYGDSGKLVAQQINFVM